MEFEKNSKNKDYVEKYSERPRALVRKFNPEFISDLFKISDVLNNSGITNFEDYANMILRDCKLKNRSPQSVTPWLSPIWESVKTYLNSNQSGFDEKIFVAAFEYVGACYEQGIKDIGEIKRTLRNEYGDQAIKAIIPYIDAAFVGVKETFAEVEKNKLPRVQDKKDIQKVQRERFKRSGYTFLFQKIIEENNWESFLDYAVWAWQTQNWSLFNSALAFLQRDGCVYLATEVKWNQMGRTIKSSANPIVIMVPFGPITFVYDLADTEGEYVPKDLQCFQDFIEPLPQAVSENTLIILKNLCNHLGIVYSEKRMGARKGGEAKRLEKRKYFQDYSGKNKKRKIGWFEIVINGNCNTTQKALSLLHELGHILCGHLILDKILKKDISFSIPDRSKENLTKNMCEWEAEKVCVVACRMLGMKYDSAEYLDGYGFSEFSNTQVGSLRIALDAADKIIRFVSGYKKRKIFFN